MFAIATDPQSTTARRAPYVIDAVVALALALFSAVGTYFASHGQPHAARYDAVALVLVVLAASVLAWRRRYPVGVLIAVFAVTLIYVARGYADGPIWLALIAAYFNAVVYGHLRAAVITAVVGFGIIPWLDYLLRDQPAPSLLSLSALASWLLVLLGTAQLVRVRRERAAEAQRIRETEAQRRAGEERLRIARELHDALGHHLSLINVQSGVALHLGDGLPEQTRTSLAAINQASKEALGELRSVLEILRQEGEPAPRSPGSTVRRLDHLVEQAGAAGLEVRTVTNGEVRPLSFGVDVAAFRIVQEALTNVTRHAASPTATVTLTYGERDLTVQVDDEGRGSHPPGQSTGGKGIAGMRERVAALGGELEAGPRPEGGFRVRARLPTDGAP